MMRVSSTIRSVFDLRNCHVKDATGRTIGRLRDIVFFATQGVVSYAVIGFGGMYGFGERHVAIPWTGLRIAPCGKSLQIVEECEPLRLPGTSRRSSAGINLETTTDARLPAAFAAPVAEPDLEANVAPAEDVLVYRLFYCDHGDNGTQTGGLPDHASGARRGTETGRRLPQRGSVR